MGAATAASPLSAAHRQAFLDAIDPHLASAYWYALGATGDEARARATAIAAADDLWRSASRLDPRVEDPRVRLLAACARRLRRDRVAPLPIRADDEAPVAEARAELQRHLAAVSPTTRELYRLSVEGERSYESAAVSLGVRGPLPRRIVRRIVDVVARELRVLGGR